MHAPILARLADLFATYSREGRIELVYETVVFWGRLLCRTRTADGSCSVRLRGATSPALDVNRRRGG